MRKVLKLFFVTFFFCGVAMSAAEEFSVTRSFSGLNDESKIDECPGIVVEISSKVSEEENAKKIAAAVIETELEPEDSHSTVLYTLYSIQKVEGGVWYISYVWYYLSDVVSGSESKRSFNIKIDLKNKKIVHERSPDIQYEV